MTTTTLVAPAAEPVSLAEARAWLRIGHNQEDDLLAALIASARARIEQSASLALIHRTLRWTLHQWPRGSHEAASVRLPVRPAVDLVAVRIFDAAGTATDVTDRFRLEPGREARICWTFGGFPWPGRRHAGIEIDYVAGMAATEDAISEDFKLALLRLITHAYHTRDADTLQGAIPQDVAGLIAPWRRVRL